MPRQDVGLGWGLRADRLTFDIQGVGGQTVEIFYDVHCPRTVLCVHTRHMPVWRLGWRSCVAVMVGEGGVFSTCAVVSGSKNERVVTLANSPLGLWRCRLVDEELERVDADGFGRSMSEISWKLLVCVLCSRV